MIRTALLFILVLLPLPTAAQLFDPRFPELSVMGDPDRLIERQRIESRMNDLERRLEQQHWDRIQDQWEANTRRRNDEMNRLYR